MANKITNFIFDRKLMMISSFPKHKWLANVQADYSLIFFYTAHLNKWTKFRIRWWWYFYKRTYKIKAL